MSSVARTRKGGGRERTGGKEPEPGGFYISIVSQLSSLLLSICQLSHRGGGGIEGLLGVGEGGSAFLASAPPPRPRPIPSLTRIVVVSATLLTDCFFQSLLLRFAGGGGGGWIYFSDFIGCRGFF